MRALLIVLDSVGIGNAPDAAAYGDEGVNTLGHIREQRLFALPNLDSLGLVELLPGRAEARPSGDMLPHVQNLGITDNIALLRAPTDLTCPWHQRTSL